LPNYLQQFSSAKALSSSIKVDKLLDFRYETKYSEWVREPYEYIIYNEEISKQFYTGTTQGDIPISEIEGTENFQGLVGKIENIFSRKGA